MNTCRSKSTINPYFKRPKINNLNPQHITNKNSNSPRTFNFFRHISLHSATRSHSTPLGYDDTVLVAGVYRLSKLSEHWNGFNTKKQQQVATLSQIFFINLIVFLSASSAKNLASFNWFSRASMRSSSANERFSRILRCLVKIYNVNHENNGGNGNHTQIRPPVYTDTNFEKFEHVWLSHKIGS